MNLHLTYYQPLKKKSENTGLCESQSDKLLST